MPHSWAVTPKEAVAIQRKLAARVEICAPKKPLRWIAGLDAAFSKDEKYCIAAVVLWDMQEQRVEEQHTAKRLLTFPYVPGLLSFREIPALLAAMKKLKQTPDALMCDGQGRAHPRRIGIASHLGVVCGLPSLGCAKSRLIGEDVEPGFTRGSAAALIDKEEIIGSVLRTQDGVRPVYASVGHLMDQATVEKIILDCAMKYRLPEPTRLADRLVAAVKRGDYSNPRSSTSSSSQPR